MNHFYKHEKDGLCLTFSGLLWLGYPLDTIKSGSSKKSKSWPFVGHPEDGRKKLLPYELLDNKRKSDISTRLRTKTGCTHKDQACHCGDIYHYVAIEPIKAMIEKDLKAEAFYLAQGLPDNKVRHHTYEASILNMMVKADDNIRGVVKEALGFKSVSAFWDNVIEIIKEYKSAGKVGGKFPTSYERLVAAKTSALKAYRERGYESLIHGLNGKRNAAKVGEESADVLKDLLKDTVQKDDVLICMLYNRWAVENGQKPISPSTVGNWRRAYGYELDNERYGKGFYNEKYIRQVKGRRPSMPLYLAEHDDNNLDFLFQDGKYQFYRYVAIVVSDSYNDLILGKSVMQGNTPAQWQVAQAYLDAMYYIRSLTGGWYLPFEIKADRWASASLQPFYDSIARMAPPSHGNKHRGYIEQLFGSTHWKRCQQLVSQGNWSGNNITANSAGLNPDMLEWSLRAKERPMIGQEAEMQIEKFFHLLRKMPAFTRNNMDAPSKEAQWLEAWNNMHEDDKRPITEMQFLQKFGIVHRPKHTDSIRISNRGVEPQINKVRYSYDLPEPDMYRRLNGAKVQVVYDPYDMSRVLITNGDDIRFIATEAMLAPRALRDGYTGSRTYLNAILAEKTEQWGQLTKPLPVNTEAKYIESFGFDEAMLKGNGMIKELKNAAEQALIADRNDADNYINILNDM